MITLAQQQGISVVLLGVPIPGLFLHTAELYARVAKETGIPFEGAVSLPSVLSDNRSGSLQCSLCRYGATHPFVATEPDTGLHLS